MQHILFKRSAIAQRRGAEDGGDCRAPTVCGLQHVSKGMASNRGGVKNNVPMASTVGDLNVSKGSLEEGEG